MLNRHRNDAQARENTQYNQIDAEAQSAIASRVQSLLVSTLLVNVLNAPCQVAAMLAQPKPTEEEFNSQRELTTRFTPGATNET